jgi:hypothetical protein
VHYYSGLTAEDLRFPRDTNWIISMYCSAVCHSSNSVSCSSAPVVFCCGEGYIRLPQNGFTSSPVRKICRAANCVNMPLVSGRLVDGRYCTSTTTPLYRLPCLRFAHHIRQSRPHSIPRPSNVTVDPGRSCHPLSILARISLNEAPSSMTLKLVLSSCIQN